ncbi:hypothetical protein K491DRAFT_781231 [Lophiostoma macrostomum CBS 122681]|uniref:TUG ubiquitin-like domain-containing protein n=1 Tax=Lophiostoma macrostomum CBS 122681 TaxID=1314788 RepID=A0A6A6T073_9PLEO|nr:hypothetical protein K491DRAFT_781231 [Lophiostoma macrostomum CBS 122681]
MSHVVVFNSSAKTVKIATNPTKYLTEVRDEACQKLNVSKDQFTLKYNNKPVSLSQQIRLANLPQGARLELVQASRSPTVISVALQLPVSDKNVRLTQKFASNTSLWEVLRKFESGQGGNYNFTQRGVPSNTSGAGRLNYEMPVITVMPGHREQSSFVGLQQTLSQLGFDSGSALLRLSFQNSGTPLEEAMAEISQYFTSSDTPAAPGAHAADASQQSSVPDLDKAPQESTATVAGETVNLDEPDPEPMDVDPEQLEKPLLGTMPGAPSEKSIEPPTQSPPPPALEHTPSPQPVLAMGRNVQIYSAPTSSTPQAARRAWNERDYEPTIEHAKSHQAALVAKTRNQRLLSDKELADLETARVEKLNASAEKGSSLRIRMPDQTIIQMAVTKDDTADALYSFVEGFLEHKEPFQLKYVGTTGRQVLISRDTKRLIHDLRFSPAELITFLWDDQASSKARTSRPLAKEWQDKAQALKVEEPATPENNDPAPTTSKAEGKKKAEASSADKESKLKSILGKGLFKR